MRRTVGAVEVGKVEHISGAALSSPAIVAKTLSVITTLLHDGGGNSGSCENDDGGEVHGDCYIVLCGCLVVGVERLMYLKRRQQLVCWSAVLRCSATVFTHYWGISVLFIPLSCSPVYDGSHGP